MIKKVFYTNFMGGSLNPDKAETLSEKNLFIGANRAGKSTRSTALTLLTLGYVPGVGKKNADIHAAFATTDKMTVAAVIGGVEFERRFYRSQEKGSVTQGYRVNKSKRSAKDFAVEMAKAGAPTVFDLSAFMALSDAKKIDHLFQLYPPAGDIRKIDSEIEKKTRDLNALNKRMQGTRGVIQRLTASKAEIALPAGSLAEAQGEIAALTEQVKAAQEDLKAAEIKEAEAKAAEEAKKKAEAEAAKAKRQEGAQRAEQAKSERRPTPVNNTPQPDPREADIKAATESLERRAASFPKSPDPAESIRTIIKALEMSGCKACTAAMIAKRELKKFTPKMKGAA